MSLIDFPSSYPQLLPEMTKNGSSHPSRKVRRRGSIDVVDAKVAVDLATAQTYSENVFLFVPNLIGMTVLLPRNAQHTDSEALGCRVHAYHPRRAFTPLHELSPQILYSCIRHIMSIGCRGRTGRTRPRADVEIWCGFGHGHGSVRSLGLNSSPCS